MIICHSHPLPQWLLQAMSQCITPAEAPTSNLSTPFEVGAHLGFDHGDSVQGQGPLCGGISNVIGCCEKNTIALAFLRLLLRARIAVGATRPPAGGRWFPD